MERRRVRAPSHDEGILVDPDWRAIRPLLARNQAQLAAWHHDFQGRDALALRHLARQELLTASRELIGSAGLQPPEFASPDPWIVTGHQPELFHPGVWAKNFACAAIARQLGGTALNFIVDNDIPHRTAIRVPTRHGPDLAISRVEYDHAAGDLPYEDYHLRDPQTFASFGPRVEESLNGLIADPLIHSYWNHVQSNPGQSDQPGLRFAMARHAVERDWGFGTHEALLSRVCETEAFRWFACHILAHLERFRAVHNAALARYRQIYRIRSPRHPVPALETQGDWQDAPFWVWRTSAPRRHQLLVRQTGRDQELRIAGEDLPFLSIPLAPDRDACCAVEQLRELGSMGIRLRTRALTTTLFTRLLVGDLFIHGIGGAKYDELGDAVIRDFFHIKPPGFMTLSLTLWPGLPDSPASLQSLHTLNTTLRELEFNPDRVLTHASTDDPLLPELIAAKHAAIAMPVATRPQRIARFQAIRRANQAFQDRVSDRRRELLARRDHLRDGLRKNLLAHDRNLPLVVHSAPRLQRVLTGLTPELSS